MLETILKLINLEANSLKIDLEEQELGAHNCGDTVAQYFTGKRLALEVNKNKHNCRYSFRLYAGNTLLLSTPSIFEAMRALKALLLVEEV